jgi:hypothetical protein
LYKEFYVLGVGDSSHSRAALTPNTCHRQLFGAAQSLHLRKYVRTLPDILFPISGNFFAKGLSPTILVRMMSLLCEHKRHHPSQNIEFALYFCKKVSENLRMCNFCSIFAGFFIFIDA